MTLTTGERRELVLAALKPDANKSKLCREYGVPRMTLYRYLAEATEDPERSENEAHKELIFRRQVVYLTGGPTYGGE